MDTVTLLAELRGLRELLTDAEREYARTVAALESVRVDLQTQIAAAWAEVAELRAVLAPLAGLGRRWAESGFNTDGLRDDCPLVNSGALTMGDARRAAELLARTGGPAQVAPAAVPTSEGG